MKPMLCEKRTYTVAEIAKILGVSKGAAYSLVKENTFKQIIYRLQQIIERKYFFKLLEGDVL